MMLHQLFTVDELNALDAKELDILKTALQNEIVTSPQIRALLRAKAHQVYSQLKPGTTPKGP
jgi:hypothetical protein